ncbi:Uncharacterised protein [Vibrio cholerae]|nr:Uncharacterised protein [Vibrio cholerae]
MIKRASLRHASCTGIDAETPPSIYCLPASVTGSG